MSNDDLQELVVRELRVFFAPLLAAADSPSALAELLVQIGWDPAAVPVANSLQSTFGVVRIAVEAIDRPPETLAEVMALQRDLSSVLETLRSMPGDFEGFVQSLDPPPDPEEVAGDLLSYLVTRYLWRRAPVAYWSLVVLDIVRGSAARPAAVNAQGYPVRMTARHPCLNLDALWSFLDDPVAHLAAAYVPPGGLQTVADARTMSDRLFPRLVPLLAYVSVFADYARWDDTLLDPVTARRARSLQVRVGDSGVGADFAIVARDEGGPGLSITPASVTQASVTKGNWLLTATLDGSLPPLLITENGIDVDGSGHVRVDGSASRLADPATNTAFTIGSKVGSRLELGLIELLAFLETRTGDFGFGFDAENGAVVLQASDGDGFLQKILPPDGIRADFALGVAWSKQRGLRVAGAVGIEVEIPLGKSLGEVVHLQSLYLAVRLEMQRISAAVGISFGITLGPIGGTVTRVGLRARYGWADSEGFSIRFLPPTGAGLSIDAGVTGGGFLEFDEVNERYAGILALKFGKIGITAIGLVTTRMPDGSKGFSLLINIGVTFDPPIQLSMGFTLAGVGGLIGVNRTMMIDVLREGVKKRTLDSILFPEPEWVIPNAAKVISDLRAVFPPAEGRFIVGPMVKIGYGTPRFIVADIGIFLELFDPIRIVLLGQLAMELPDPKDVIVRIRLDIVGVLDFQKKELSFQASLYDSGILEWELVGDSALFLGWGAEPAFAMSLGGFHPKFTPPPPPIVFAGLRRLGLNLSSGSNFQLGCGVYQALTPNSLQFGARADLYAAACGAVVNGYLSFDTLIYFSPFSFSIDLAAGVQIRYRGASLADVRLALALSGPTPWNARGSAVIKVLFFELEANFNITWGRTGAAQLPAVDPWPALEASLLRADSWGSSLPAGVSVVESLRKLDEQQPEPADGEVPPPAPVIVHPAGMIEIRQNVAPLETTLQKFGNVPVTGHDRFRILRLTTAEGATLDVETVDEFFSRGQFEELSNSQKLSVPAFEKMPGGVTTRTSNRMTVLGEARQQKVGYESIVIHADGTSERSQPADQDQAVASWSTMCFVTTGNAARRCNLRASGDARFAHIGAGMSGTAEETYAIVYADSLVQAELDASVDVDSGSAGMTRSQADRALAEHLARHPEESGSLMVIPLCEVEVAA